MKAPIKSGFQIDMKHLGLLSEEQPFDLLMQLVRVTRELEHELTSKLAYFELSNGKLKVLLSLLQYERPLNPSELADLASVTRSTITGLLDGLEKDGFISRSPLEDRRKTAVCLTEKGREVIRILTPLYTNHVMNTFSKITKEEQQLFMSLLYKIKEGLQHARKHTMFPE
ncbi:MarR family winged helix-turn-helix transcriptional regulator [Ectobacillus ponti]|uniref:MarR family transcriptional regulator n=1 Tax=Ectobacillus ponti TaxID=2961894 RepID=A0AA42BPY0_9BACI|nr:MarR family transcriptional regulator [Ectobacillus ponti]MCP8969267.1 MarR family transcriptional regulator [Ectobacillus ponti]